MRQLRIHKPRTVCIEEEVDIPEIGPEDILVKVDACGICGTDVHIFKGEYLGTYPVVPGHEFAGTVEKVGRKVKRDLRPGDRVAVEPNIACGECGFCRLGKKNFCAGWNGIGVNLPGGFSEFVWAPSSNVFPILNLPFEEALFMEPLSCVLHGLKKFAIRPGMQAFIAGAGSIGILMLQALKSYGVNTIVGEPSRLRRNLAKASGAVHVIDTGHSFEPVDMQVPAGFDLVVDATGVPAVMEQLIGLVKPGGEILLFGVPPRDADMTLKPFELFRNGITMHSSYTSVDNSQEAIMLLESGKVDTTGLISHTLGLDEFEEGMRLLDAPDDNDTMKVIIRPGD